MQLGSLLADTETNIPPIICHAPLSPLCYKPSCFLLLLFKIGVFSCSKGPLASALSVQGSFLGLGVWVQCECKEPTLTALEPRSLQEGSRRGSGSFVGLRRVWVPSPPFAAVLISNFTSHQQLTPAGACSGVTSELLLLFIEDYISFNGDNAWKALTGGEQHSALLHPHLPHLLLLLSFLCAGLLNRPWNANNCWSCCWLW